jgi:radical SAM superfamily enzyme YgiQ (UPF0313 family)
MVSIIYLYPYVNYESIRVKQIQAILNENGIQTSLFEIKSEENVDDKLIKIISESMLVCFVTYGQAKIGTLDIQIKEICPSTIIIYECDNSTENYLAIIEQQKGIDFIALGNAGYSIVEFLEKYDGSNIKSIIEESPYLASKTSVMNKIFRRCDINDIPWNVFNKSFMANHLFTHINTSIGCSGSCSFCGAVREKWSGRSPLEVLNILKYVEDKYNVRAFHFSDKSIEDPITECKKRFEGICDTIIESGKKFALSANIRAETFNPTQQDIVLLKKARKAGFVTLFVGIESGNDHDLKLYNKRATVTNNEQILKLLSQCEINPYYGFIMINPLSTEKTLEDNFCFLSENECYIPGNYIFHLVINENLPIAKKMMNIGVIEYDNNNNLNYNVGNAFCREIYRFIEQKIMGTDLYTVFVSVQDYFRIIDLLTPLLYDVDSIIDSYNLIKGQLSSLLIEYFSSLYIKKEISAIYNEFDLFKTEICENYTKKLMSLVRSLFIKYQKQYGSCRFND